MASTWNLLFWLNIFVKACPYEVCVQISFLFVRLVTFHCTDRPPCLGLLSGWLLVWWLLCSYWWVFSRQWLFLSLCEEFPQHIKIDEQEERLPSNLGVAFYFLPNMIVRFMFPSSVYDSSYFTLHASSYQPSKFLPVSRVVCFTSHFVNYLWGFAFQNNCKLPEPTFSILLLAHKWQRWNQVTWLRSQMTSHVILLYFDLYLL